MMPWTPAWQSFVRSYRENIRRHIIILAEGDEFGFPPHQPYSLLSLIAGWQIWGSNNLGPRHLRPDERRREWNCSWYTHRNIHGMEDMARCQG